MKSILLIGHHDVRLFLRDRSSYVWLFLIPLAFTWVMSWAAREPGGPADARPAIVIDNQDTGFMGRVFLRELGEQGLKIVSREKAGDTRLGLTLPADFTARVLAKEEAKLQMFVIEGTDTGLADLVRLRLWRTLIAINVRLARHAIDHAGAVPTEEGLIALLEEPAPVSLQTRHAGRKPRPVKFNFSLPGNLVGYLFINLLIFGGASVAQQRRDGVLRRAAVHPVTSRQLLCGKIYGLLLLAGVQTGVMLGVGQFVFGVNVGEHLFGILLTLLVFAWVAASAGVLIGFLVKSEDKVVGLCLAIGMPMVAIGGCWWPLEVGPAFFQKLAFVVPPGWAVNALHQFITFGAGLEQALPSIGVLALFGLAANLAAMKCFRV